MGLGSTSLAALLQQGELMTCFEQGPRMPSSTEPLMTQGHAEAFRRWIDLFDCAIVKEAERVAKAEKRVQDKERLAKPDAASRAAPTDDNTSLLPAAPADPFSQPMKKRRGVALQDRSRPCAESSAPVSSRTRSKQQRDGNAN